MNVLRKIFDYSSFALLSILAIPTVAILISWNALPGNKLYSLKRRLEKIALVIVGIHFETKSSLQSKLIDRRFNETAILLDRSSGIGLPELTAEIESAKKEITQQAKKEIKKEENKEIVAEKAVKLIAQLQEYDQKLEEKKQTLSPTHTPSISKPTSALITQPTEPTQDTVKQVDQAQEEIRETVDELEQITQRERMQQKQKQKKEEKKQTKPHPQKKEKDKDNKDKNNSN